jgi:hypothetical protein
MNYVAIGVVAHTSRMAQAKNLARSIKAEFISIDDGMLGAEGNHEAVQHHLAGLPTTWSVCIEDDGVPVPDFNQQLHNALIMSPSPIVSCYLGRKRPPHWQKRIGAAILEAEGLNTSWIVGTHLLHAVGYAIKTELLPSLLEHESTLPVDEHISDWARRYGHLISYTVPSLVDHADQPTIVEHPDGQKRRPGRKAWKTGTRDHWTTEAVMLR